MKSNLVRSLRNRLRQLGPALILATVVLGPGSLALSTIAGSLYGYQLLWVPIVTTLFMITYTWLAARIGLVTGMTLFQATRSKYGRLPAYVGGVFGFLSILAFQAGNNAAVGFAANALLGGSVRLWAAVLFVPALALIFLPNLYDKLELLVKLVVGLMIVAFVGTLALVGIDGQAALAGLAPGFPDPDAVFLALGITATTFSIAAAAYQTYLMQEKKWGPEKLGTQGFETFLGIGLLGTIAIVVLLTSAGALYGQADPVFSAQAMARQLEPLVGPAAFHLFTIGFFFASFSSLVINPLIGGTLLADGFEQDPLMEGPPVKAWTALGMAAGLAVVLVSGESPVQLLRIAQAMAIIAFPVLGYLILALARDRDLMGRYRTPAWIHTFALLGYVAILAVAVNYLRQILQTF